MPNNKTIPNLGGLIQQYKQGVSLHKIAKAERLSQATLTARFKKAGVKTRNHLEAVTKSISNLDSFVARYNNGEPLSVLAKELDIASATLAARFKRLNVSIRERVEQLKLTARRRIPNLNECIARYKAGEPISKIAKEIGIADSALANRFKASGVRLRSRSEANQRVKIENLKDLIKEYRSGKSLNQISAETGIERGTLTSRFRKAGVKLRNQSQAESLKWSQHKGNKEKVKIQLQKAWDASRGRTDAPEVKAARAKTRHIKQTHVFYFENEIANVLRQKGCKISQQYPIGQFNTDIAFNNLRLVIEITHSGWDSMARRGRERERAEYILNQGWCILYVKTYFISKHKRRTVLDLDGITNFIINFSQRVMENKSFIGKYAVVRGDSIPLYTRTSTLDGLPRIYNL